MLAQIKRSTIALALVAAPLAFLARPGSASADEPHGSIVRKGVYEGIWHTDPVKIIIESVDHDGTFKGEIHFDPNGRWGDVRAPFTARLGLDDSITMGRDDCVPSGSCVSAQIAHTGRPVLRGREIVWKGEVKGPDFCSSFELCIPMKR